MFILLPTCRFCGPSRQSRMTGVPTRQRLRRQEDQTAAGAGRGQRQIQPGSASQRPPPSPDVKPRAEREISPHQPTTTVGAQKSPTRRTPEPQCSTPHQSRPRPSAHGRVSAAAGLCCPRWSREINFDRWARSFASGGYSMEIEDHLYLFRGGRPLRASPGPAATRGRSRWPPASAAAPGGERSGVAENETR